MATPDIYTIDPPKPIGQGEKPSFFFVALLSYPMGSAFVKHGTHTKTVLQGSYRLSMTSLRLWPIRSASAQAVLRISEAKTQEQTR